MDFGFEKIMDFTMNIDKLHFFKVSTVTTYLCNVRDGLAYAYVKTKKNMLTPLIPSRFS